VRSIFNKVQKAGFIEKVDGTRGYVLREDFKETRML
jgi:DNA-binding IscR family transcriptional regulator